MTPRTPSPPSNMEVETLCFGGVFLLRGQDNYSALKGPWTGPCQGQGIEASQGIENGSLMGIPRPRQQRSGSRRSTLRSWSGLAGLQTLIPYKICGGSWRFELPNVSLQILMTWRGSAKRSGQNPSWDVYKPGGQLQETSDLCDCQQGFCHQVLSHVLRRGQILITLIKMQINV